MRILRLFPAAVVAVVALLGFAPSPAHAEPLATKPCVIDPYAIEVTINCVTSIIP